MVVKPLGIEGGILAQRNRLTILIASASAVRLRIPAVELESFTGKGIFRQRRSLLFGHGLRLHRTLDRVFFASVGVKGNSQHIRLCAAPNAAEIGDNIASACGRSFSIRAVSVMQLGRGDGNSCYIRGCIHDLISLCCRSCAGCQNNASCSCAAANIRTTCRRIQITVYLHRTVDVDHAVYDITCRARIGSCRRICYRLNVRRKSKILSAPFIRIINKHTATIFDRQYCIPRNNDFDTRQKRNVLCNFCRSAVNGNRHIIGNWKNIVL